MIGSPRVAGVGQALVERALDPGGAATVDIGIAEHMRGEAGLRIEPLGLALDRQARLTQRIDRLDQRRARRGGADR